MNPGRGDRSVAPDVAQRNPGVACQADPFSNILSRSRLLHQAHLSAIPPLSACFWAAAASSKVLGSEKEINYRVSRASLSLSIVTSCSTGSLFPAPCLSLDLATVPQPAEPDGDVAADRVPLGLKKFTSCLTLVRQ